MVEDNLRIAWAYIRLAFRLPWSRSEAERADKRRVE